MRIKPNDPVLLQARAIANGPGSRAERMEQLKALYRDESLTEDQRTVVSWMMESVKSSRRKD